jgi:hypothetical protein
MHSTSGLTRSRCAQPFINPPPPNPGAPPHLDVLHKRLDKVPLLEDAHRLAKRADTREDELAGGREVGGLLHLGEGEGGGAGRGRDERGGGAATGVWRAGGAGRPRRAAAAGRAAAGRGRGWASGGAAGGAAGRGGRRRPGPRRRGAARRAAARAHVFDGVAQPLDGVAHAADVAGSVVQERDLLGAGGHRQRARPAGGDRPPRPRPPGCAHAGLPGARARLHCFCRPL